MLPKWMSIDLDVKKMLPKWMSIDLDVKENVTQVNVYRYRC